MAIAVAFTLMGAFFMAGLYVAGAIGVLSLIMMSAFSEAPLWDVLHFKAWSTYTDWDWVAIPLFILMGELVLRSGMAEKMYSSLSRWVALLPGGLLHTNIVSSALFAACAGSTIATAATISRVALPSVRSRGYNERIVLGSLAAGFVPGFMIAGVFMVMMGTASVIWPGIAPREHEGALWDKAAWRERIIAILPMLPMFALIVIVLGTIYTDVFVPSEAAAAGATGAFFLAVAHKSGFLVRRLLLGLVSKSWSGWFLPWAIRGSLWAALGGNEQTPGQLGPMFKDAVGENIQMLGLAFLSSVRTTSMIMLILMAAFTLQFAFARLGISNEIGQWVSGLDLSPVQLVLVLVVFYLLLGTFMESYSMIFVTLPLLLPTLRDTGVDLFWFGIILVILFELAQISPPQGMALYVLQGARREINTASPAPDGDAISTGVGTGTIVDVYIGVLPFIACMLIVLGLLIAFPEIVTWFPNLVKGKL